MENTEEFSIENMSVGKFLEKLRILIMTERTSRGIVKVDHDIYEKIKKLLEKYEEEIHTAFTKSNINISSMKNELREYLLFFDKIRETLDEFLKYRVEKILQLVTENYGDSSLLTPEERVLYEDIKNAIMKFREVVYPNWMHTPKIEISSKSVSLSSNILQEETKKTEEIGRAEGDERDVILYMTGNFPRTIATHKRNHKLRKEDIIIISEMYAKVFEDMGFGKKYEID